LAAFLLLSAGLPAAAQDNDMASRMLLELQQMREEVRELRGMVESQAREIENLKRRQRDQYVDLDRRLSSIGSAPGAAPRSTPTEPGPGDGAGRGPLTGSSGSVEPGSGRDPIDAAARPEGTSQPAQDLPEVREPIDETPEVATLEDPGTGGTRELQPPGQAEQEAYDQAFLALRETRYADAAEGFDRFLRDHPESTFAPNALYWLGEVYYVTRDFETALDQFERLQQTYPDSGKQPDAVLKIGFSHYELGQWERARAALEEVIAEYPGTNYSRLAENRLRTMRLEGNL
jgi:tol-pal system protein YbgF